MNIDELYPLTIIADRYSGTYSDGLFTAWNLFYHDIPDGPDDGDVECMSFWATNTIPVGKGATPNEAVQDLIINLLKK